MNCRTDRKKLRIQQGFPLIEAGEIAKMILDKDQDFESLISKKISDYISSFETARSFSDFWRMRK